MFVCKKKNILSSFQRGLPLQCHVIPSRVNFLFQFLIFLPLYWRETMSSNCELVFLNDYSCISHELIYIADLSWEGSFAFHH